MKPTTLPTMLDRVVRAQEELVQVRFDIKINTALGSYDDLTAEKFRDIEDYVIRIEKELRGLIEKLSS